MLKLLSLLTLCFLMMPVSSASESCFQKLKQSSKTQITNELLESFILELIDKGLSSLKPKEYKKISKEYEELSSLYFGRFLDYKNLQAQISYRFKGVARLEEKLGLTTATKHSTTKQDYIKAGEYLKRLDIKAVTIAEFRRLSIDPREFTKKYLNKESSFESFRVKLSQNFGSIKEFENLVGIQRVEIDYEELTKSLIDSLVKENKRMTVKEFKQKARAANIGIDNLVKTSFFKKRQFEVFLRSLNLYKLELKWDIQELENFFLSLDNRGVSLTLLDNTSPYLHELSHLQAKIDLNNLSSIIHHYYGDYKTFLKKLGLERHLRSKKLDLIRKKLLRQIKKDEPLLKNRQYAQTLANEYFSDVKSKGNVLSLLRRTLSKEEYQFFKTKHYFKDIGSIFTTYLERYFKVENIELFFIQNTPQDNFKFFHQALENFIGKKLPLTRSYNYITNLGFPEEHFIFPQKLLKLIEYYKQQSLFKHFQENDRKLARSGKDDQITFEIVESSKPDDSSVEEIYDYYFEYFFSVIGIDEESLHYILKAILLEDAKSTDDVYELYPDLEFGEDVEIFFEVAKEFL